MKLWGKVSVIEELEQVITRYVKHSLDLITKDYEAGKITKVTYDRLIGILEKAMIKDGGIGNSGLGGDMRSRVFSRLYELQLNGTMVAVKLGFDYRDMTGEVHIRDDKIWKVAVQMPNLVEPFSRLKPFYTYFGGKRFV